MSDYRLQHLLGQSILKALYVAVVLLLLIGSNTEECWSSSLQLLLHLNLWAIHELRSPLSPAYLCGKQQVSVV